MRDIVLALGPALFGLLGAVCGALIALAASTRERHADEDNEARDALLGLLRVVDVNGGRYRSAPDGSTAFVVNLPEEGADALQERLSELQVRLLAAGVPWCVVGAALLDVSSYIDQVRADEEVRTDDSDLRRSDPHIADAARRSWSALSGLIATLERGRRYRRSWRAGYRFGVSRRQMSPWLARLGSWWGRVRSRELRNEHAYLAGTEAAGRLDHHRAARLLRRAATRPGRYQLPAAIAYARLLGPGEDRAGAAAMLRRAADASGDGDAAADARLALGDLCEALGDAAGSADAYEQATQASHPAIVAEAHLRLAQLCARRGDTAAACPHYQAAMGGDDDWVAATAASELVEVLDAQGDAAGALRALRLVVERGPTDLAGWASEEIGRRGRVSQLITTAR
jgi:hypothetical protein